MPTAYVLLNVELGSEDEVLKSLSKMNEVTEAYRVYGSYDTLVKVSAETTAKLKEVVTWKIRRLPNVNTTLTMITME